MITPVLRRIDYMIELVEGALEKVSRYEKQLEEYSGSTTAAERRSDVGEVLGELNEYGARFAKGGELPPCSDIRVIYGLWAWLYSWHEFLSGQKKDDYLATIDGDNTYENPMDYLLQARPQAEGLFPLQVIPKELAPGFLESMEREVLKKMK